MSEKGNLKFYKFQFGELEWDVVCSLFDVDPDITSVITVARESVHTIKERKVNEN